jgi:hypothetical protein
MRSHTPKVVANRRGALVAILLGGALLLWLNVAVTFAGKKREKPGQAHGTIFHRCASLGMRSFDFNTNPKQCGDAVVLLMSTDFFNGLVRIRDPLEMSFRYSRNSQPVEQFPDTMEAEVRMVMHDCADPFQRSIAPSMDDPFMSRLSFEFCWMRGAQATPAETILIRRDPVPDPEDGSSPQWRYYFRMNSMQIPITDSLSVRVMSPDGMEVVRIVSGMDRADTLRR